MNFRRLILSGMASLSLAGCTVTEPVVVIMDGGQMFKGTATASMSQGSFSVTDGKITCGGHYNSSTGSRTISMPVLCSDGRRGIVIATRDDSLRSGAGTVRMDDGSQGTFMFGGAAASF